MNVEIGTEVAQFPEKEYINGIFLAVYYEVETFFRWIGRMEYQKFRCVMLIF